MHATNKRRSKFFPGSKAKSSCRQQPSRAPRSRGSAFVPTWAGLLAAAVLGHVPEARAQEFSDGAPAQGELTPELAIELDSYVAQATEAFDVPGAAVAIIEGGEVVYRGAFGVRGLQCPGPVDLDTRFMIGSITKSMTATLLGTLVDDGLLGWDDAMVSHLPSFALADSELGNAVTLRQALSHSTGVPRHDLPLFFTRSTPLELIDFVATIEPVAAPGEAFNYQNQVFSLAGFAGARAAGARLANRSLRRGYAQLLEERLFEPVGMRRATVDLRKAQRQPNHACAHGYSALQSAMSPIAMSLEGAVSTTAAAGAIWASVDDMAHYAAMQVRQGVALDGVRVISRESLAETHAVQVPLGPGAGYGMGWLVREEEGLKTVEHSGGTAGFNSQLLTVPELGAALVVLTNRNANAAFVQAVQRYVTELYEGLPHTGDADLLEAEEETAQGLAMLLNATRPVSADEIAPLAGRYASGLRLFERDGNLVVRSVHGDFLFRAVQDAENLFLAVDNVLPGVALVPLVDPDSGGVTQLRIGFPDPDGGGLTAGLTLERRVAGRKWAGPLRHGPLPSVRIPEHACQRLRDAWPQRRRHRHFRRRQDH